MSDKPIINDSCSPVEFDSAVLQDIRRHARGSIAAEICGVLIGDVTDGVTRVEACIAGEKATEGGAHVTFTQQTWEHIYKVKDAKFAESSIVGWYHSHPGFGIFLSDYDLFIHKNFFAAPHQVAWVFDPHSDEEGCFGWVSGEIGPIERISVLRQPTETYLKAAGVEPDVRSMNRSIAPSSRLRRLVPFAFRKWAPYLLSLAVVFVLGSLLSLMYLNKGYHKGKTQLSQAPSSGQRTSGPLSKSKRGKITMITMTEDHENLGRNDQNIRNVRYVIRYKSTGSQEDEGWIDIQYVYDYQKRKVSTTCGPFHLNKGINRPEYERESCSVAKRMADLLFKEK